MDAASAVFEEAGLDNLAIQLETLTHNQAVYIRDGDTRLKVRHTNRDRAAYDEVMTVEPPVDHDVLRHSGSLITRAHRFFLDSVREWLGDEVETERERRASALTQVLSTGLQLVVIDLQANENSQEIFETLNARGTPLTAADLVKNYVFQRLEGEGVDTRRAYAEDWPFETKFWEADVSVGRYRMTRSSLFLNQWLGTRVGEEISPKSTFSRFKHYVEFESGRSMSELLRLLKVQAGMYEQWTVAADDPDRALDTTEMAIYRMKAASVELLKPVLIWLHDPERPLPQETIDGVISAMESWVVRRQLLRLTSADLGRIVAEIIKTYQASSADELIDRVTAHLSRLRTASTYWPGDDEVRRALREENAYRRFPRARLRMFLEAVEDHLRAKYNTPPVPRRGYPIEHVLPQKWESRWPVEGLEAELARGAHVHRLGNLTLLTNSLNSAVSNGPWSLKRGKLTKHDVSLINRDFYASEYETWDEPRIQQRTDRMIDALLSTWPVPPGHLGEVPLETPRAQTWVEVKHLIAAGLLEPGTRLSPRSGAWEAAEAVVRADGMLDVDGAVFETPSAAGAHVKGNGGTNGWVFWRLPDGRKLADVRAEYRGERSADQTEFDWSALHVILEALPKGAWTTYGDLADVIGTAAQPLGNHIRGCRQCANAHRVLTSEGRVAENFTWTDPDNTQDPLELLLGDGVQG